MIVYENTIAAVFTLLVVTGALPYIPAAHAYHEHYVMDILIMDPKPWLMK